MCKYIHYNVGLKYMFGGFFPVISFWAIKLFRLFV